jgi:hypothetical protein
MDRPIADAQLISTQTMATIQRRSILLGIVALIGSGAVLFVFPGQHQSRAADERPAQTLGADEDEAISYLEQTNGIPAIRLPATIQAQTGMQTQTLETVSRFPETHSYGTVMSIQPLLQMRARYHRVKAEQAVHEAALARSQLNYERLRDLYQDEAVSARRLQEARSQWQTDKARTEAAREKIRDIRDEALQLWGAVLSTWTLHDESKAFSGLLSRRAVLLLITLDPGQTLPDHAATIFVSRTGARRHARKASRISAAPQTDRVSQGETYFFLCDSAQLRTGMRIDAWIPQTSQSVAGVDLPSSAVVWHAGKPWVYVRTDEELFARRTIPEYRDHGSVWFVTRGFFPGEVVVATGAQMLLSEEFRRQIPEEDDD